MNEKVSLFVLPQEWQATFILIGICTCACILMLFAILGYFKFQDWFTEYRSNKRRENLYHCCQKCGSYTPYYRTRYGDKWNFSITYCPNCGHYMESDRPKGY